VSQATERSEAGPATVRAAAAPYNRRVVLPVPP
jgi:hypothetical protein